MTTLISHEMIKSEEHKPDHESWHVDTFQGPTGKESSAPWNIHAGNFTAAGTLQLGERMGFWFCKLNGLKPTQLVRTAILENVKPFTTLLPAKLYSSALQRSSSVLILQIKHLTAASIPLWISSLPSAPHGLCHSQGLGTQITLEFTSNLGRKPVLLRLKLNFLATESLIDLNKHLPHWVLIYSTSKHFGDTFSRDLHHHMELQTVKLQTVKCIEQGMLWWPEALPMYWIVSWAQILFSAAPG